RPLTVDEIHRMNISVEEILYSAMEVRERKRWN
ncbi:MAG: Holliday junction helicase RuvB P-loop domain, partial [Cyanobacteriota bacterium]